MAYQLQLLTDKHAAAVDIYIYIDIDIDALLQRCPNKPYIEPACHTGKGWLVFGSSYRVVVFD